MVENVWAKRKTQMRVRALLSPLLHLPHSAVRIFTAPIDPHALLFPKGKGKKKAKRGSDKPNQGKSASDRGRRHRRNVVLDEEEEEEEDDADNNDADEDNSAQRTAEDFSDVEGEGSGDEIVPIEKLTDFPPAKRRLAHMARVEVALRLINECGFPDKFTWMEWCVEAFDKSKDALLHHGKRHIAGNSQLDYYTVHCGV